MIEVTVKGRQIRKVAARLKKFNKKVTNRSIIEAILLKTKADIKLRTQSGLDFRNQPFTAYNPRYAKSEGKTLVNLTKSGDMLNLMSQKVLNPNKGIIFFSRTTEAEKAERHMTGDGVPKREFFGVSKKNDKNAVKIYQKRIKQAKKESQL